MPDPAVQKSLEGDLALLGHDDDLLRDVALAILWTAKPPNAHTRYLLRTVPGLGAILRLVLLYAIHASDHFPRGQDLVSSCRLVKRPKESAGKRYGTSGAKIGNACLQWAFSKALEWGDKIPVGVIYQDTALPTYEDQVPVLKELPLVQQEFNGRVKQDAEKLKEQFC